MRSLKGTVAIVTGASRGVGKGVALGLAEYGATVYVTGRTDNGSMLPDFLKGTTIYRTADEINKLGGVGIPHKCDHGQDEEVAKLFERVEKEQGRLDILVNSAWNVTEHILKGYFFNTPFWEQPVSLLDDNFRVGLRSNYVASQFAAKIMTQQKSGLIVNISYPSYNYERQYLNNVTYGVCKVGIDKLSADTAHELKEYGVAVISLYPGVIRTEGMIEAAKHYEAINLSESESPQFVGRCVAVLANDKNVIRETGNVLITAEIAVHYGFTDVDGKCPRSPRAAL